MRAPAAAWTTAIEELGNRATILIEIQKSGSTLHRFALHDADLTFDTQTWTAASGSFQQMLKADAVPEATLVLDNVGKAWNARLSGSTDYRKAKIIARIVDRGALGTATAVVSDYWWIDRWDVDHRRVTFKLGLQVGLLLKRLPGRTYSDYCPYVFKSTSCGYSGSDTTCSKRLEGTDGCRTHFGASADKRFGGFPNRPAHLVIGIS